MDYSKITLDISAQTVARLKRREAVEVIVGYADLPDNKTVEVSWIEDAHQRYAKVTAKGIRGENKGSRWSFSNLRDIR